MKTVAFVVLDAVLLVAVARVLSRMLDRVRQPPVLGEVLAGLVLGAAVLGALPGDPASALFPSEAREVLGVLGKVAVVAYLFTVGAELDPRVLRREGRAVALVSAVSFVVPWLAGAGLALALHGGVAGDPPLLAFTLFLGTAIAVTAFPVLSRIVDARNLRERPAGRIALGAAAAQELLVWPALAVAVALAGGASAGAASPGGVVVLGAVALALVVVLARRVVPWVAARRPALAGPAVLAGLAISASATELSGLHVVLGGFLFGATLPRASREAGLAVLRTRVATLALAATLPLFFALPALGVDPWTLGWDGLGLFALVLAVAVAAKLLSASAAAGLAGLGRREALTVGALMNARGLVELVVLSVGLQAGLIDDRLFAVMVLMALATTFAAGPLVDRLARPARRRAPGSRTEDTGPDRRPSPAGGPAVLRPRPAGPSEADARRG